MLFNLSHFDVLFRVIFTFESDFYIVILDPGMCPSCGQLFVFKTVKHGALDPLTPAEISRRFSRSQ